MRAFAVLLRGGVDRGRVWLVLVLEILRVEVIELSEAVIEVLIRLDLILLDPPADALDEQIHQLRDVAGIATRRGGTVPFTRVGRVRHLADLVRFFMA